MEQVRRRDAGGGECGHWGGCVYGESELGGGGAWDQNPVRSAALSALGGPVAQLVIRAPPPPSSPLGNLFHLPLLLLFVLRRK